MNFEAMIAEALKSGMSEEDIAKNFTEALNKSKKKKNARAEMIDDTRKKVMPYLMPKYDEATAEERYKLIGDLLWLLLVENGYCGTKDAEQLNDLRAFISNDLKLSGTRWFRTYKQVASDRKMKSDMEIIDDLLKKILS